MAELVLFCAEIRAGTAAGLWLAGDAFGDADAGALELPHLVGIVGEKTDFAGAELFQDFSGEAVVARVGREAEFIVGFDGVHAGVLELVGFELVHQADAAALLREIEQDAGARFADFFEGEFELGAAVAAFGGEDVAGEALRVDADQRRGTVAVDFAVDHGDGGFGGGAAFEAENFEVPELRGEFGAGDDAHFRGSISFGHPNFGL